MKIETNQRLKIGETARVKFNAGIDSEWSFIQGTLVKIANHGTNCYYITFLDKDIQAKVSTPISIARELLEKVKTNPNNSIIIKGG